MGKRSREEALANGGQGEAPKEVRVSKKIRKYGRKEKSKKTVEINVAGRPSEEDHKEKKRLKNSKETEETVKDPNSEVNGHTESTNGDAPAAEATIKPEKVRLKEQKRAKKASTRKLANNGTITGDVPVVGGNGHTESTNGDVEVDAEAAKRAEKARLREEKRAKKAKKDVSTPDDVSMVEANGHPASTNGDVQEDAEAAKKTEKARLMEQKRPKKAKSKKATEIPTSAGVSTPATGYAEDVRLTSLPQTDIDSFLSANFITITDPKLSSLRPITSFEYLPPTNALKGDPFRGFKSPTPIQAAAWPFLLSGRDVIGVAETGSGKTLAFAVPCIRYIKSLGKVSGAKAVMVSPTRELALQIYEQVAKLAGPVGLEAVCVYGGVSKDEQRKALRTASIVVATPGRLNDLINEGVADLSGVGYVVLDEADRMLDKGFEEEIRKILATTPPTPARQTLMFTATWPPSVLSLASTFLTSPVKIAIGENNPTGDLRANSRIAQTVEVVDPRGKETRLLQLLKQHQSGKARDDRILVFCLYKKEATRVEGYLKAKGLRAAGIHGDLSQAQRTTSLDAFKSGRVPILVATDVAARGLDIPAVKLVINVTFPLTVEDYVHRIGRTGRAGAPGTAITLFTEHDKAQSGALINVLKAAGQPVPDELLKFGTTVKKKGHDAYGAFYRDPGAGGAGKSTKIKFDD
ncbi:MAG: RNA-dependent ATPase [Thelocarpon impressellum]|nr:MAG: RNA-dependent ATPase [Thelocarpon impressellum]